MRRGRRSGAVRGLVATLTVSLGALLAAGLAGAPSAARADEPESWVRISIEAIDPAVPERDGTVRLSGTVTNTSSEELSNLQAIFWRSLDPVQDGEGMAQALASPANEPLGKRQVENYRNIPSEDDRVLAPGESTRFSLSTPIADLELPQFDGIYLIGVHVRGRISPEDADQTLGRGRIFLPLVSNPPDTPARIISLVLLTSRPSLVRDNLLADDHLSTEVGSGGRLRLLLSAAAEDDTSFAVDPALIEELEVMSGGYRVESSTGSDSTTGRGQAGAIAWLADFDRLVASGDGYQLPYGNPDIAALVHHGQTRVLDLAAEAAEEVETTEDLPLLVAPAGGTGDKATVAAAAALDPNVILLSDASVRGGADALGPVREGLGEAPIVVYSTAAAAGGPGPAPRETPAKLQQRMLSDTWLAASSAEEGTAMGRVRVITGPRQAAGADADADVTAPWLRRSTLAELLQARPASWNQRFRYTERAAGRELTGDQLETVRRLGRDLDTVAELLTSDDADDAARAVLPRAASAAWRGQTDASRTYTTLLRGQVTNLLRNQVTISVIPKVITTGRTGSFPITVTNDIAPDPDDPEAGAVRVRVRFDSANSQRMTVAPLDLAVVPAGASVTADARVEAKTNGTVLVYAELETVSGTPVGRRKPIEVQATQAGTTGWVIALVAGIVLIGTTALRIRQVARERSGQPDPVAVSRPADEQPDTGQHARESLDV